MPSILNEIETRVLTIDPKDHTKDYPFENLVFNGGGAKMISYVGAVKVINKTFLELQKSLQGKDGHCVEYNL